MEEAARPESRRWVGIAFTGLLIVNLVPLLLILRIGGERFENMGESAAFLRVLVVCSAAPLAAWVGIVGARRGWSARALACLGVVTVGWPAFVVWAFLQVVAAFPKC